MHLSKSYVLALYSIAAKSLVAYVVAYEQNLHFKQVFEVAKLLGLDKKYTDGLTHIAYGMTRLATGRCV